MVYSTRVHARIPNGHPREDPREEKRARRASRRTSQRGSSCVAGSDKRAALPQLTASYSCGKLNGEVAGHADILATILARKSARMSRGCYEETAAVEFKLMRLRAVLLRRPLVNSTLGTCRRLACCTFISLFLHGVHQLLFYEVYLCATIGKIGIFHMISQKVLD